MKIKKTDIELLEKKAKNIRYNIIRMIGNRGSGHPGGSLSIVEILVSLYFAHIHHDPKNPSWAERDRFILSKGHGAPALYVMLAEAGYFQKKELQTFRKVGSILQGHPDRKLTPGIDASTGSLGQGFSFACGVALGAKLLKRKFRTYAVLGDGELDEVQVWECAMSSAHYKLDNLTAIVDRNRYQNDGHTEQVMRLEPLKDKWEAFGWNVIEINGHDFREILSCLQKANSKKGMPTVIIAHTTKGKGVSYMENNPDFHGLAPTSEQSIQALKELE